MPLPSQRPKPPEVLQPAALSPATRLGESRRVLSLVVPVFNEEAAIDLFMARIGPALEEALLYLAPIGVHEMVFVDDVRTDGTVDRIVGHARHQPEVKLLRLSRNFCQADALPSGLRTVSGAATIHIALHPPAPSASEQERRGRN